MLQNLYFIELFPYSSRRIEVKNSISEYVAYEKTAELDANPKVFKSFNFKENDGLNTMIYINGNIRPANYLLVTDEKSDGIKSRWFVIEAKRTTKYAADQYQIILRRDLLADFTKWADTPAMIQKGFINDRNSPLLFNRENMNFNMIKRGEYMIPDDTQTQWVVGYIANDATLTPEAQKLGAAVIELPTPSGPASGAIQFDTLDDFYKFFNFSSAYNIKDFAAVSSASVSVLANIDTEPIGGLPYVQPAYYLSVDYFRNTSATWGKGTSGITLKLEEAYSSYNDLAYDVFGFQDPANTIVMKALNSILGIPVLSQALQTQLMTYNGKTIYIRKDSQNYRVEISAPTSATAQNIQKSANITVKYSDPAFNLIAKSLALDKSGYYSSTGNLKEGDILISYNLANVLQLVLIPENTGAIGATLLDPNKRTHLSDAPYDMFCIPYGPIRIKTGIGTAIRSSESAAWSAAMAIVTNLAAGTYDLQLLPYCPARGIIQYDQQNPTKVSGLDASGYSLDYGYSGKLVKDSSGKITEFQKGDPICPIIWCGSSEFSFIATPAVPESFSFPLDPETIKIRNETESARLVSPNLSGGFDFSPMMNGGVSAFRVDCTFKPFNPYIHIAPIFAHMYGGDYQDARGLICGGDFSLPRISSSWENYQQNNKNFQNIFDREIQDMRISQEVQRSQNIAGMIAGTFQGASSGAMVGGLVGGPIGMGLGAAAGAGASLAGGFIDLANSDKLNAEAIDYRRDLFGYNLQNIRALPNSLAKSAAQNANNRPFPFIEYYSATDIEKNALKSKIEYNGETIGIIAKPIDYMKPGMNYIQAIPAGYTPQGIDSVLWSEICGELIKGCYYENDNLGG